MRKYLLLAAALLMLVSCENESYDSGDTRLSYLRADFGMVHVARSGQVDFAVTDDGDRLSFVPEATVSWAGKADSVYRALIYYKKVNEYAQAEAMQQVLVASLYRAADVRLPLTDPLVFESAWVGGGYLNVGFSLKTGENGNGKAQSIGFMYDSTIVTPTDTTVYITMLHGQNGVPEYYSSRGYVSVSLPAGSHCVLRVNTYKGWVEKRID